MSKIITFESTHDAIHVESELKNLNFNVRIVATPETISASCGLALKYSDKEHEKIQETLSTLKLQSEYGNYDIVEDKKGHKAYEPVKDGSH